MSGERGIYGEIAFVGVALGYDDENGFTASIYMSASLGVSADRWGSISTRGGLEGWTTYLGVGLPTGTSVGGVTGGVQTNLSNGDTFGTLGVGITDLAGVGVYGEGISLSGNRAEIEVTYTSPIGQVSSARAVGQVSNITISDAYNTLDAIADDVANGHLPAVLGTYNPDYDPTETSPTTNPHDDAGFGEYSGSTSPSFNSDGSISTGVTSYGDLYGEPGGGAVDETPPGTGGGGNEENHSEPSTTGYSGKSKTDLEGPETTISTQTPVENTPTPTGNTPPEYDYDAPTTYFPIILDLDHDGVEITFGQQTFFDMDSDGYLEQTSWASADDGFLVIDLDKDGTRGSGDGLIDQTSEIVWSLWGEVGDTDLQALGRAFDDNANSDGIADNIIDANDAVWSELRVWQDFDQDGITDKGELFVLAGVTAMTCPPRLPHS